MWSGTFFLRMRMPEQVPCHKRSSSAAGRGQRITVVEMKKKKKRGRSLGERYPASEPCRCDICKSYCLRPGWWTVQEAFRAMDAGYGNRMMLEIAPDMTFGVLSPAFGGCEGKLALQEYARNGCGFLKNGLCELHGTGHEPLECLYCHHLRKGLGQQCHADLEKDWQTAAGRALVKRWLEQVLRKGNGEPGRPKHGASLSPAAGPPPPYSP